MQMVGFLIPLLDDKFPLIRSISCWTISRFSKYVVQVLSIFVKSTFFFWKQVCLLPGYSLNLVASLIVIRTNHSLVLHYLQFSLFDSGLFTWRFFSYLSRKVATRKATNNLMKFLWVFYEEYWILTSVCKRLLAQLLQH
jgi:hypothetical protein